MARTKTAMQLIANGASRRSTFKKRRASVIKKTRELSTLCGVPACTIVYGPDDPTPDVWPPQEAAARIISRFLSIPEIDRAKNMVDGPGLISKQLEKLQSQFRQVEDEMCRVETAILLHDVLSGQCSVSDVAASVGSVTKLWEMVGTRIKKVHKRMEELLSVPQSVGPAKGSMFADVARSVEDRYVFGSVGADVASTSTVQEQHVFSLPQWRTISADMASLPVGPEMKDETSGYFDGSDFEFEEEIKALLSSYF